MYAHSTARVGYRKNVKILARALNYLRDIKIAICSRQSVVDTRQFAITNS